MREMLKCIWENFSKILRKCVRILLGRPIEMGNICLSQVIRIVMFTFVIYWFDFFTMIQSCF